MAANDSRLGIVRGGDVHDVTHQIIESLSPLRYPLPWGDPVIGMLEPLRETIERAADIARPVAIADACLLSPVANPSKIIGTPVNYLAHTREAERDPEIAQYAAARGRSIEEQGLFLKAVTALVGPSEGVAIKFPDRRTDHEVELGVVIGKRGSDIPEENALDWVAGYTIALDMVIRGPEDRSFRKSLDTFAVLGPWLVTPDELGDPSALSFSLEVNGELRQKSNTGNMILGIPRQIAWASTFYTLYPGDIIMTGTCEGVGPVRRGDRMTATFERIGSMEVRVD